MKMKKVFAGFLSTALAVSVLAGCGGGTTTPASSTGGSTPSQTTSTAESGSTGAGLKIAIVTSPSGVDDGSFNQDNYNGILSFKETHPDATDKAIREPDMSNVIQAVDNIVGDYDVVVTPGFQFSGISQTAVDNPEKKFILVDAFPNDLEDATQQAEFDNIYAMMFAEQESGFFAGVAAALETKTGKVAVVNGVAFPSNVNYQFGFESGVNYANAHLSTKAELVELPSYAGTDVTGANVGGNYTGDFSDEAAGKVVGEALLNEGVDIIFVAAGASGNGVFTAVKEDGNSFVIGCDVDQFDDGKTDKGNIILTSVLKVMGPNVDRVLNTIQDGSFKGGNFVLGADTDSTGYVKEEGRQQLTAETLTALEEVYTMVKDGKIVPASNFNGHTSEEFPGLK